MKSLLRSVVINSLCLFFISQIIGGLIVKGGFGSYLFGGLALALLFLILKPILSLLSVPLNIITLGFFSVFTNIIIFYLLTVFVPAISISAFMFQGYVYAGFVIPKLFFNSLFAFAIVAFLQSIFASFISWLFTK
ncbi:phage holin family protein [Patescibacteria group bacterium]|nr:phage holin family protein [Patescibacteria group bacterium]